LLTGGRVPSVVLVPLAVGLGLAATMAPDPRLVLIMGAGVLGVLLVVARLVTRR
jgi:hypothetical protein